MKGDEITLAPVPPHAIRAGIACDVTHHLVHEETGQWRWIPLRRDFHLAKGQTLTLQDLIDLAAPSNEVIEPQSTV